MGGRLLKAIAFSADGEASSLGSTQLPEDAFTKLAGYGGTQLQVPPYPMEQLVFLAELQPVHAAALEQKVLDIVGSGPQFVGLESGKDGPVDQRAALERWWSDLTEEYTPLELLQAVWSDYETTGWGLIEVVRDIKGAVRRLYHVPAHTVRAHQDTQRFAQVRGARIVWFRRWGLPDAEQFSRSTGRPVPQQTDATKLASDLLVFRKPSRRSTWYGIPTYISAVGHITLAVAARDYNVLFFENAREPRHLIIITGLEEDVEGLLGDLVEQFKTQMRDPHRNLLLPIVGDAKVQIEKMALPQNDLQFAALLDRMDGAILVAHRVPPDRVAIPNRGALGGTAAAITNAIYKEGVVSKGQRLLEHRLNRFLRVEWERMAGQAIGWQASFAELDIVDESADVDIVTNLVRTNLLTLNEGRVRIGFAELPAFGQKTYQEWIAEHAAQKGGDGGPALLPAPKHPAAPEGPVGPAQVTKAAPLADRLGRLEDWAQATEEQVYALLSETDRNGGTG